MQRCCSTSRHAILPQDPHDRSRKQPMQIRLQRHGHSMSLCHSLPVRLMAARGSSGVHVPKGSQVQWPQRPGPPDEGLKSPFRERRPIKLAIVWQCGRARNGWSAQRDQVFSSCRSANPGSLGTTGTIMRCDVAAGADEHDGCARIAAGAALGPNTPAPQVSIPMCTSRKHHGCAGRGKRISNSASVCSPCKYIPSGTRDRTCALQDGRFHRVLLSALHLLFMRARPGPGSWTHDK